LISNFSNEFTYSKISKICEIKDIHTTKNYIEYLKEAFVIIVLDRFSPKKQQIIAPKKVYAVDQGLCNFVSFRISKDISRIFENIVCVELMRRKSVEYCMNVYYWKDYRQNEVDFVIKRREKVDELIQVCYDVEDINRKGKEIRALLKANKELKCNNLLMITNDYEAEEKIENKKIKFIPLWKWLLYHCKI
jgi:predicted AAA+ superfamily ATPase